MTKKKIIQLFDAVPKKIEKASSNKIDTRASLEKEAKHIRDRARKIKELLEA